MLRRFSVFLAKYLPSKLHLGKVGEECGGGGGEDRWRRKVERGGGSENGEMKERRYKSCTRGGYQWRISVEGRMEAYRGGQPRLTSGH